VDGVSRPNALRLKGLGNRPHKSSSNPPASGGRVVRLKRIV
jgi:hypothetical protein